MDKLKIILAFFFGWTVACGVIGGIMLTQHKTFEQKYAALSYEDKRDTVRDYLHILADRKRVIKSTKGMPHKFWRC